jgi:hypothetical protein
LPVDRSKVQWDPHQVLRWGYRELPRTALDAQRGAIGGAIWGLEPGVVLVVEPQFHWFVAALKTQAPTPPVCAAGWAFSVWIMFPDFCAAEAPAWEEKDVNAKLTENRTTHRRKFMAYSRNFTRR